MAPPKKAAQKMDLASFLADDTFGGSSESWVDDFNPDALAPQGNTLDIGADIQVGNREMNVFPVPDRPPYTARITEFPNDATEETLENFFITGLNITDPEQEIEHFSAPKDPLGRLRKFAFITFTSRSLLEKALGLNDRFIGNSQVYVSVAAPQKDRKPRRDDTFDFAGARGSFQQQQQAPSRGEWSSGREDRGERRPRREEPQLDFASIRGSAVAQQAPARGGAWSTGNREERGERKPRREEPQLDFASIRGSAVAQQTPSRGGAWGSSNREERGERKPRKEEPQLDFASIRGSAVAQQTPSRGGAWGSGNREERGERKPRREEPQLDFASIRGSAVQPSTPSYKKKTEAKKTENKGDGPKSSSFALLATEDDEDEE